MIKQKIEDTEANLIEIEDALKKEIKEIGSTRAGELCNLPRQNFTNYIHGQRKFSYETIIKVARKIFT